MNSKRKSDSSEVPPATLAEAPGSRLKAEQPHVIHATAVYTADDLRRIFGLKSSSVRRERRMRRLRMAKRCGRYFCLGQWVLQWIEGGELKPASGREEANTDGVERDRQPT